MAYNEDLALRIAEILQHEPDVVEKKMFGGLAFMIRGKMCCGIVKDELMMRMVAEKYEEVLQMPHAREMDFTGRTMKGFAYIEPEGLKTNRQLKQWIDLALEYAYLPEVAKKKKAKK